jgi:hypothetical protein
LASTRDWRRRARLVAAIAIPDENGVFDEPGTATTTLISQYSVGTESLEEF